jgi:phosphoglycerate dehydrogenase-like enzyme
MMPFTKEYQDQTLSIASGHTVRFIGLDKPTQEQLEDATVIIGNPAAEDLALCRRLRWLQLRTAGTDAYLKSGVLPAGTVLTNASGGYGTAISEYLLAATFALCKQMHRYRDRQNRHIWQPAADIRCIARSTVLVVGSGDIGSNYAKKMHALGARVNGIRRNLAGKPEYFEKMGTLDDLDDMLPEADIVALCLPATSRTTGLMNAARLSKMKRGALLLNIGRGVLVDTQALMSALDYGQIAGAALDVTDPEPLPQDHPLWDYENVIITPHSAGGEYFGVIYDDTIAVCLNNLKRYLNAEPLKNVAEANPR